MRRRAIPLFVLLATCRPAATAEPTPAPAAPDTDRDASAATVDAQPEPRTAISFEAIDAWIACRNDGGEPEACEAASAKTPWGAFAEQARPGFGPPREDPPSPPSPAQVEALVAQMRRWEDPGQRVAAYFPEPMPVDLQVAVVGNGHGWGDMYTRPYEDPRPASTARVRGPNAAVINAVLVAAQYGGDPEAQAASAYGVLEHETFHLLFHAYRDRAQTWTRWDPGASSLASLQLVVLNEGIAHFVDRRDELVRDGFPPERADTALTRLGEAAALLVGDADQDQAEALLRTANQGPYWDKYGSIAGMFFAHAVFEHGGLEALRDSVRCGPGRLVVDYVAATEDDPELPRLPESVAAWAAVDLCKG